MRPPAIVAFLHCRPCRRVLQTSTRLFMKSAAERGRRRPRDSKSRFAVKFRPAPVMLTTACLRLTGPYGKDRAALLAFFSRFSYLAYLAACCRSSVVEHSLGKGEVDSSILSGSTIPSPNLSLSFRATRESPSAVSSVSRWPRLKAAARRSSWTKLERAGDRQQHAQIAPLIV